MLRRLQLVWKVIGIFLIILVGVLGISGWVTNVMYERAALTSARDVSRISSDLILHNIREIMRARHPSGLGDLIDRLATNNPLYRDIRVTSHDGRVVAARAALAGLNHPPAPRSLLITHLPRGKRSGPSICSHFGEFSTGPIRIRTRS